MTAQSLIKRHTAPEVASDKAARWNDLVSQHRASFSEVIALASKHPRDAILRQLCKRAEAGLHALDNHKPQFSSQPHGFGSLGEWGDNGHGPAIRFLLFEARLRAERLGPGLGERG